MGPVLGPSFGGNWIGSCAQSREIPPFAPSLPIRIFFLPITTQSVPCSRLLAALGNLFARRGREAGVHVCPSRL